MGIFIWIMLIIALMVIVYGLAVIACMIVSAYGKVIMKYIDDMHHASGGERVSKGYSMNIPLIPLWAMCFLIAVNIIIVITCIGLI